MAEVKIKTEVFSRVSGYFRPVSQWNKGKREEFSQRIYAVINRGEDANCTVQLSESR